MGVGAEVGQEAEVDVEAQAEFQAEAEAQAPPETVDCPVCSASVALADINAHIDGCEREEQTVDCPRCGRPIDPALVNEHLDHECTGEGPPAASAAAATAAAGGGCGDRGGFSGARLEALVAGLEEDLTCVICRGIFEEPQTLPW